MNIFAIVGLIISIPSALLGFYSFINGHKKTHYIWGFFSFSVSLWGFGIYKIATAGDVGEAILWWRMAEISVILMPALLTHFVLAFLNLPKKFLLLLVYVLSLGFILLDLFSDYFIRDVRFVFNQFYYIEATMLYTLFVAMFLGVVVCNVAVLIKEYKKRERGLIKHQIKYLAFAFVLGFSGGATSFLPVYNIDLYPILNVLIFASVLIVVYTMFKYQFLDIKIIATQLLLFVIWSFLFGRLLLSKNLNERMIDAGLLLLVMFFGVLLIRSVLKEIKMRERMELMTQDLIVANARLKELDKVKSDFISITSHQLRSPLTSIKGYASMILEGSFGIIPKKAQDAVDRIMKSSQRLIATIEDFLDVGRIESGKMRYVLTKFDLEKMLKEIIEDFVGNVQKARDLNLEFIAHGDDFIVTADQNKIRQVLTNLIDNSIKYTPKGFVKTFLSKSKKDGCVVIEIKDTGVGIEPEVVGKLFHKFSRADGIELLHTEGLGLGLYVADKIIKSHKGKIWVESGGDGKGSSFFIKLPINLS